MNYILTGAAGFIGFHTAKRLLDQGHTVWGLDSVNSYYDVSLKQARLKELGVSSEGMEEHEKIRSSIYTGFVFYRMKLEDRKALSRLFADFKEEHKKIDGVINFAAQAGVRYSIERPEEYISANIYGFLNILEECRANNVPHLIYASSSSVYGLSAQRPYSPHNCADHPISMYAATKRSNELMAHTYSHLFGLPVTGLRFFTVYGPWGRPDMAYYKFSRNIREHKPIEVYNQGNMYRDFTYIDDIVDGIMAAVGTIPAPSAEFSPEAPDPCLSSAPFRIYNLGNHKPVKLSRFIEVLEESLGQKAIITYRPLQDGDVLSTEADISDSRRDLHWEPKTSIEDGLKQFALWFNSYCSRESEA
ncbi:NAD-dependent epimerase [Treponema sp. OttesenSCG-928-L16]|nr:NAD-dependent epimerase [Treponema sp. OttesenSCG-928-L16]